MPINQASKDKPVHCIACGKIIAEGYVAEGSIRIQCRCGVKNRIEAEHKPEGRQRMEFINVDTSTSVSRTWP